MALTKRMEGDGPSTLTNISQAPQIFILDVDGMMRDGAQYYTAEGKFMKRFGPDDHDGLSLLKKHMEIRFVSGDGPGFEISRRRIEIAPADTDPAAIRRVRHAGLGRLRL
jgi:hypothetical protein